LDIIVTPFLVQVTEHAARRTLRPSPKWVIPAKFGALAGTAPTIDAFVRHIACKDAARTGIDLGQPQPESPAVETRLIIAYSLIAIMIAFAIFGGVMFLKKQGKSRRRDEGRRSDM
jgi:hypothetical protein